MEKKRFMVVNRKFMLYVYNDYFPTESNVEYKAIGVFDTEEEALKHVLPCEVDGQRFSVYEVIEF